MNIDDQNDQFIIVEPEISYNSSFSRNFGVVSESSVNFNSNKIIKSLFPPSTERASLRNTIMLPLIINNIENVTSKDTDYESNKINNDHNHEANKFLLSRNKTFSTQEDLKERKIIRQPDMKNNISINVEINPFNIGKEKKNNSIDIEKKLNKTQNDDSKLALLRKHSKPLYLEKRNYKSTYIKDINKKEKSKFHNKKVKIDEPDLNQIKKNGTNYKKETDIFKDNTNENNKINLFKSCRTKKYKISSEDNLYKNIKILENKEYFVKNEVKKNSKNFGKISMKDNQINVKILKSKYSKETNMKISKHKSSNISPEIYLLKEKYTKNDDNIRKDNNSDEIKNKKVKNRKSKKRNSDSKNIEMKDQINIKIPSRRVTDFIVTKKMKIKDLDKNDKAKLAKNKNEKETNFIRDNKVHNTIVYKSNTNKNMKSIRIRKKRSITMYEKHSKIIDFVEQLKEKNDDTNVNFALNQNLQKYKYKFDFDKAMKKNSKKMQFNMFSQDKFTNTEFVDSDYLKYTLNCFELIINIDMNKQTRLKNKINFNFPKPKKKGIKKKICLFDLDETLVHCTGDIKLKKEKFQHSLQITLPGKQAVQVGINLRPYWKQTLNLIKKYYHIVVYTASHQAYADAVLDFMDPKKKYFKYRLYRNNCSLIDVDGAKFYVKDLDIFNENYDLKDIVIIDNSVLSFAFHLHNGIPIVPYYDEDKEGSLYVVGLYLLHIYNEEDLREANKLKINLDSFIEKAKKQQEQNEKIINEESDIEEEEEKSQKNSDKSIDKKKDKEKEIATDNKITNRERGGSIKSSETISQIILNKDITDKNLVCQSKLINMYYTLSEESSKSLQMKNQKFDINDKDNKGKYIEENNDEKDENKSTNYILNDKEIDCKSDLCFFDDPNNIEKEDNVGEMTQKNKKKSIKRINTIIEDEVNNDLNCAIKGKLKFIRSKFFNDFKI